MVDSSSRERWLDVLDLPPDATEDQIEKRFRQLALAFHPDANPGDSRARQKFLSIREAYERLAGLRTDAEPESPPSPPPPKPPPGPPSEPDDPLERTQRAWSGKQRRNVGWIAGLLSAAALAIVGMTLFFRGSPGTDFPSSGQSQEPPGLPVPPSAADSDARDLFLQALEEYRSGPKREIESEGFAAWNAKARAELEAGESAAVAAFARDALGEARSSLARTAERAERELAALETAFRQALNAADGARTAADLTQASGLVAKALQWKPEDSEALALARQIENLPALVEALEEARVARVENRPVRELEALRRVLALDADWPEAEARAQALSRELAGKRYARALGQGLAAAAAGKLELARERLDEVRAFAPGREETLALEREVAALARRIDVRRAFELADAHAAEDRWNEAAEGYASALQNDPGHGLASERLDRAREILATREVVESLLARPERLGEAGAERGVAALIDRGLPLAAYSPSLAISLQKLAVQSERYRKEISVRVVSDGRTNVAVRGVGRVGEFETRLLQLRPGRYTFEGRRKGYRHKLVDVALTPEDDGREIRVACDTRLETR